MTRYSNIDRLMLPPNPPDARSQLVGVLDALVEDYGAERIIAFGSCVRGSSTPDSDVDLCVVREHPASCTRPGQEADAVVARRRPLVSTDILVRTPEQMRESRRRPFGVMEEVIRNGVVLYER